jgi:Holliday junction resolvase RusA-like endonuclease
MRIEVRLDGPPRGKGAGRAFNTRHGARIFTDDRTRKFESQLRYAAQQVMSGRPPLEGALSVCVEARFQIPVTFSQKKHAAALAGAIRPTIRPDCENFAKAMDALNGVVWVDDKQIVDEHIRKVYAAQPGLIIIVEEILAEAPLLARATALYERVQATML